MSMSDAERREALARVRAGESPARVARDYGVTRQAIHSLARRGIGTMGRPPKVDAAAVTKIRDLRAAGLTWAQVAEEIGVSQSTARKKAR